MYNENESVRPLVWLGATRKAVRSFPSPVRREIGVALYAAQRGEIDPSARPMKGFGGSSVVEIVSDFRGDTWGAVYTVRFADVVCVLHAFQKKSRRGIATPKQELDLIRARLIEAERMYRERQI